jgi:far upstream element-binding protein
MQSYLIQDNQKRLFREMISANAKVNPEEIKEAQTGMAVTQAQPVVRRESATYYYRGYVAGVNNVLMDQNKIKRKIFIPTNKGFNFAGLIIGPKGANQKRLEEETGCKILVRGKGSQKEGQPAANDDWDPLHVMIAGDSEAQVARASAEIERIIFADEQTRSILRQEQLKIVQQIKNNEYNLPSSGYAAVEINYNALGIINPTAYILPVPNECVGLLLGDGGETIRQIQKKAEAHNVQMQADSNPNSKTRNVYVEGSEDAFLRVKKLIDEIIDSHMKLKSVTAGAVGDSETLINVKLSIPVKTLPTVVGKSSETLL